jgi:hypothetical protein
MIVLLWVQALVGCIVPMNWCLKSQNIKYC